MQLWCLSEWVLTLSLARARARSLSRVNSSGQTTSHRPRCSPLTSRCHGGGHKWLGIVPRNFPPTLGVQPNQDEAGALRCCFLRRGGPRATPDRERFTAFFFKRGKPIQMDTRDWGERERVRVLFKRETVTR